MKSREFEESIIEGQKDIKELFATQGKKQSNKTDKKPEQNATSMENKKK